MNRKRKLRKILVLSTLPLVMWLFFNQVAFWHYHILDNGMVVQHAHPFKNNPIHGTPYQNHQHSDFEYTILAQISNIVSLLVFLMVAGLIIDRIAKPFHFYFPEIAIKSVNHGGDRLRGPPFIV